MFPTTQKGIEGIERALGVSFNDRELLRQALVSKSVKFKARQEYQLGDNDRLELLGDAVLSLVLTDYLYRQTQFSVGEITDVRAALECEGMLVGVARKLKLADWMLWPESVRRRHDGDSRKHWLGDAVEALIGALYLDQGLPSAQAFIQRTILSQLDTVLAEGRHRDAKSELNLFVQRKFKTAPTFLVLQDETVADQHEFLVGVFVQGRHYGGGRGRNVLEAERSAAREALRALRVSRGH